MPSSVASIEMGVPRYTCQSTMACVFAWCGFGHPAWCGGRVGAMTSAFAISEQCASVMPMEREALFAVSLSRHVLPGCNEVAQLSFLGSFSRPAERDVMPLAGMQWTASAVCVWMSAKAGLFVFEVWLSKLLCSFAHDVIAWMHLGSLCFDVCS